VSGFQAMGSFLSGYIGQKRWEQEAEERKKRTKQLEREVTLREQEQHFKVEERNRLLKRERATQSAIVDMIGYLGEASRDEAKLGEWRAGAMSQMFQTSRRYPDADLGTIAAFSKDAAEWLMPRPTKTQVVDKYESATGRTYSWLIDMETGRDIHRIGLKDEKGFIAGTGMTPKDFYDITKDLDERYSKAIQDYYKSQIDAGRYLQGTPFMITDGTLDPESRLQEGRGLFSKIKADAVKEVGDFRTFALPKLALALGGDTKRAGKLLDDLGHVAIPEPKVTPQHYEEVFRTRIGEVGWSPDAYAEIQSFIGELTNPTEKAYAHQALAAIMKELGDPPKPNPDPRANPWWDMSAVEGISLGLNPPMTIKSDTQPMLKDFPSMLMQDFSKLTGITVDSGAELDPLAVWDMDARTFGRKGVPKK
ncbi:MAG: hypothetical protein ACWGQW_22525, partial [bacterium]